MAAPGGTFFIEDTLNSDVKAKHHESYQQLWETKWKMPAEMGVYPFMFSTIADFKPVIQNMTERNFCEPYDWDAYAKAHFAQAEYLSHLAQVAWKAGRLDMCSEFYLRASAVYRIARFPAPRSPQQQYAWALGKEMCLRGLALRKHPVREVRIPHTQGLFDEGDIIRAYYLVPETANAEKPAPLLIIFTGLDGYRTELAVWMEGWRARGVATLVMEIPGTGDCPAKADDPTSPDRLYTSLFQWIGKQKEIKQDKVALWAFSTGGYYAIRIAHTHHDKLAGVIALGGGCHYMFERKWLDRVNDLEYPFDLANTLAWKWGYGDDVERFKSEAMGKFSLLNDGTVKGKECARLLLVNGTQDEIFPIDDYHLLLHHGRPKEARFIPNTKHMGEPESFFVCLQWLYDLFQLSPSSSTSTSAPLNPADQLMEMVKHSKPRFKVEEVEALETAVRNGEVVNRDVWSEGEVGKAGKGVKGEGEPDVEVDWVDGEGV